MSQQSFLAQNGTGGNITFSIDTFSEDEIIVYVDGVKKDSGSSNDYTIPNYTSTGGTVTWVGTAPTSSNKIRIIRQTNVLNNGNTAVEGKATFQAGSSVKAADLNNNTKQVLRAIQEQQDQKIQGYDLEDLSIGTTNIANDAVTNDKLADSIVAAIAANTAKNTNVTTNLNVNTTTTTVTVHSSDGTDGTIGEATGSAAGVMSVAHHDKLDGIEAGATGDQTNAEIRAAVDAASDSNVFTDAEKTKLSGIETGATGDQTAAEIKTLVGNATDCNVFTDADHSKLDGIEAGATADQTAEEIQDIVGAMLSGNTESGITVTYQDSDGTIDFSVASQTDENFTTADHSKLDGIEAGATADQTNAEIRAAVDAASDSNVFTDAEKTKLSGIETGATADQTASDISGLGFSTLTGTETLTNKTLTSPVINDFSGSAVVTSGTSTSDNKVYSAKRSDELYSTGASQAATSATAAANSATAAASSQTAAASSATTASTQATNAAASATSATSNLNTFRGQYYGALASDPVVDPLSNAINEGDIYFNTTSEQVRIFNGAAFQGISENSVDASRFATSGFETLYTASAGSNSINLGGLAISGAVFSNENIPGIRASLSKGSATYNLGGI